MFRILSVTCLLTCKANLNIFLFFKVIIIQLKNTIKIQEKKKKKKKKKLTTKKYTIKTRNKTNTQNKTKQIK